jgi:hypothetical protein
MIRTLVAGLGNMGRSHALAYHKDPAFEIVGLVNRSEVDLPEELRGYPLSGDFAEALERLKPDLVSIATYSDSHADYAVMAMEAARMSSWRSRSRPRSPMPSGWRRRRARPGARWWWATSCATTRAGSG